MEKLKTFRTIIKPFLQRGLGAKIPFLRNLFYRQLSSLAVGFFSPVTVNSSIGDYKIHLPLNGIDYLIRPYEEFESELIAKNLKLGDTFLDIGAGIGYHAIMASKIVGDKGRVITFEPAPNCFLLLEKNAKENGCNNIELFQKAVSNRNGPGALYLYDNAGRARIEEVNYLLKDFKVRNCFEIEIVKLDDFLGDKKIDFIKMDIEGAEYLALEGMMSLIKKNPEVKIVAEVPDYKNLEFLRLLRKLAFKIYEINDAAQKLDIIEDLGEFVESFNSGKTKINNLFCKK